MFSTPTVVGDLVLVGSCVGAFYAIERGSGVARWVEDVSADTVTREFHGDPLLHAELVVIGTDAPAEQTGYLFAFERGTGRPRWKIPAGRGVSSDIRGRGGLGYAVSMSDELLCFDLETGAVRWRFATGAANEGSRTAAPEIADDRVYFVGVDRTCYALDADSGRVVWKRDLESGATTWPAVVGGSLMVAAEDGRLRRLDLESGRVLGETPIPGGPYHGPIVAAGDSLVVLLGSGALCCLDWRASRIKWTRAAVREWSSSRSYLWRGHVLAGTDEGELVAIALADGSIRWSHRLPSMPRGIGVGGDTLYVGTFRGGVHALPVMQ